MHLGKVNSILTGNRFLCLEDDTAIPIMLRIPKEVLPTHSGKGWLSGAKSNWGSTQSPGQK